MFSALVDVLFVPVLEVGYGVVSDLSDERVLVDGTLMENFSDKRYMNSYNGSILRVKCRRGMRGRLG
jgi:uncharacterized protein YkvS